MERPSPANWWNRILSTLFPREIITLHPLEELSEVIGYQRRISRDGIPPRGHQIIKIGQVRQHKASQEHWAKAVRLHFESCKICDFEAPQYCLIARVLLHREKYGIPDRKVIPIRQKREV